MDVAIITGSAGLVGSEAAEFFSKKGFKIIGIDNDLRQYFFGKEATTLWNKERLEKNLPNYIHKNIDIRSFEDLEMIFKEYFTDIKLIIHTAAQPSHDWAAKDPLTDFSINANGTLNLLELTRKFCPKAVFIFTSTNKVYGDLPNSLPLIEQVTRWDLGIDHPLFEGINESMSIDCSKHSLFGASKLAADILVQEYGRYFGMKTVSFRAGCLTGPKHSGAELHGFLVYLMKCCVTGKPYTIYGYQGKQVRDNIHSLDLVNAFNCFFQLPRCGEVYNIGGGRKNNCSLLEAIEICEKTTGKKMNPQYNEEQRSGDHIWYISNLQKFKKHFPFWEQHYSISQMLKDIYEYNVSRWEEENKI